MATFPPRVRHFDAFQGADWSSGTLTAYDATGAVLSLTGATLRGEVRDCGGGKYFDLTLTVESAAAGTFTASLTGLQTAQSSFREGVYDIEIEKAGAETKQYRGCFRVIPEVTLETEG